MSVAGGKELPPVAPATAAAAVTERAAGADLRPHDALWRLRPWLVWSLLILTSSASAAPLVDPTRPADSEAAVAPASTTPPQQFRVSLVKLSSELRMAVVNGRSVREGDEVDGARVTAIERDGVELDLGGERLKVATRSTGWTKGIRRETGAAP